MGKNLTMLVLAGLMLTVFSISYIGHEYALTPATEESTGSLPKVAHSRITGGDAVAPAVHDPRGSRQEPALVYDFGYRLPERKFGSGKSPALDQPRPSVYVPRTMDPAQAESLVWKEPWPYQTALPYRPLSAEPEPYEALVRAGPATPAPTPEAPKPGRVHGRVLYAGNTFYDEGEYLRRRNERLFPEARRGLKNAVVIVLTREGSRPEVERTLTVEDEDYCAVRPHVLAVQKDARVLLLNAGALEHRLRMESAANPPGEIALRPGESHEFAFGLPEEFGLFCRLHRGRRSWIVVAPGPCFDVTDDEGGFTIENVPPGTYEVRVWHENFNDVRGSVTLEAGGEAEVDFTMTGN